MKRLLILIIISITPLIGISSEMECKLYKSDAQIIARCESSVKVCLVTVDGGIQCKLKE